MEGGGSDSTLPLQPCMQLVYILLAGIEWQCCVELYGCTAYYTTTATQSSPLHFKANFLYRDTICISAIILSSPAAVSIMSMIKQKLIYNLNKSSQPG